MDNFLAGSNDSFRLLAPQHRLRNLKLEWIVRLLPVNAETGFFLVGFDINFRGDILGAYTRPEDGTPDVVLPLSITHRAIRRSRS